MNDDYAWLVLSRLEALFPAHANKERAAPMAKYMRNLFSYFGHPVTGAPAAAA